MRYFKNGGINIKMGGVNKENDLVHCRSQTSQLEDVHDINRILNYSVFNMASGTQHGEW